MKFAFQLGTLVKLHVVWQLAIPNTLCGTFIFPSRAIIESEVIFESARQLLHRYDWSLSAMVTLITPRYPSLVLVMNVIVSRLDESSILSDSPRSVNFGARWCNILLSTSNKVKPNVPSAHFRFEVAHENIVDFVFVAASLNKYQFSRKL